MSPDRGGRSTWIRLEAKMSENDSPRSFLIVFSGSLAKVFVRLAAQ